MGLDPEIEIAVIQDERTGRWGADCPVCGRPAQGMTEVGCTARVIEHMNEEHREVRVGHA